MKLLPLYTAIASISLLTACSGGNQSAVQSNQAPVVKVVDDITGMVGRSIVLDASSSYDPEGSVLDVSWALTRTPTNANPTLDINGDNIVITPDLAGVYKVDVIISDGELSTTKSVSVFALNDTENQDTQEASTDTDNTDSNAADDDTIEADNNNGSNDNMDNNDNTEEVVVSEPQTDSSGQNSTDTSADENSSVQNCNIANYQAGAVYAVSDIVMNNASYFYCDVAGWCSSNAEAFYAPGTGSAWQSAWQSVSLNEACAVTQEESNTNETDTNTPDIDTGADTEVSDGESDQTPDNTGDSETQESSNHESWMDAVDTTGWPKSLNNTNTAYNNTGNVVGTYFVEWGIYGRDYHVADIPAQNLTHILYGFIPVCGPNDSLLAANATAHAALVNQCADKQDYEVTIHDKYAALEKSYPGDNWDDEIKGNFGQLMRLKASQPDIKILPSIGGWTLSDPLFDLADNQNRAVFVNSVIKFLTAYPFFDGVDIDWEFPGGGGASANLGQAQDGDTYVTLMADLRSALNTLSESTGKQYEITSAIGTSPRFIAAVDYQAATQYMDYIFMMTYDYKGSWSSELGHQTNLYASNQTNDDSLSIEISVNAMLDQGVDSTKLVVGVAKYGRGWKNITGAIDANPFTGLGNGAIDGTWEDGILDYKDIEANYLGGKNGEGINGWQYRWDESAQAAYLWNATSKQLISFDDERATIAKGNFAKQHNLAGVFSWEIDGDTGTILNAMHEGLGHKKITSGSLISSLVSESGLSHTLNSTIEYTADLTHYSIKPDNKQDLPAALNRATPNGNYHASAHWNISWRFNYQIVNAQCKIQSAQVNLTSQMLMPQLDVGFNTDSQTRDTFNEYYENLITHEFGHLDFGVLAANQIESMLLDQTTMAQCDDLGAASNAQAKSIIAQYTTLDDEYDESTSHGRTQGAYIHDLLN